MTRERQRSAGRLTMSGRRPLTSSAVILSSAVLLLWAFPASATGPDLLMPMAQWRIVKSESGPINYYTLREEDGTIFIRGSYRPLLETVVMGFQVPDVDRSRARILRWKWRAVTLPTGGNECAKGKGDSAAVVYVSWRRLLRWYTVKYVWSTVGPKGAVCDRRSNLFMAQDTVILESGGPLNAWRDETIDLDAAFRRHFADGDPKADVPDVMGVGLMTDGDQTRSISVADYAEFRLTRR